jgi:ankyrin repeat protein
MPESIAIEDLLAGLATLERSQQTRRLPPTLTAAARAGDLPMIEAFLARGASLDERTIGFKSPLAAAAGAGQEAAVERLLAAGASPRSPDAAAARRSQLGVLRQLFAAGLGARDPAATDALEWAAVAGRTDAFRFLIERGVTLSDRDRAWAIQQATRNGFAHLAAFLRGEPVDLAAHPTPPLPSLLLGVPEPVDPSRLHAELAPQLLAAATSGAFDRHLRRVNGLWPSLLSILLACDFEEAALVLIGRGAPVTKVSRGGDPPLVVAAANGYPRVVAALLDAGAGSQPAHLERALLAAAEHGLPESVRLLLDAGADPRTADQAGQTAMTLAAGPYRRELRRLLRQAAQTRGGKRLPALVGSGRPAAAELPAGGSVADFVTFFERRHPEWQVLAVAAPIEVVTPALAALRGAVRVETDVARRTVAEVDHGEFVVQFAGHPWTLELRALGWRDNSAADALDEQAESLARQLSADVVAFVGSDAVAEFGLRHIAGPSDAGAAATAGGAEPATGATAKPKSPWTSGRAAQRLVAALGLRVPPMVYQGDGYSTQLALHRLKTTAVRRLDHLAWSVD